MWWTSSGMAAWFGRWMRRVECLRHRTRIEHEMDEEFRFHVEMETEEHLRGGLAVEEARRRALLAFGGVERYKEAAREGRGTRWIQDLAADLRYGIRTLRNSLGFTAVAVLTLALGIGANTAIFSVINSVLLEPLPYEEPARLVRLYETRVGGQGSVSLLNLRDWQEQSRAFEGIVGYTWGDLNLQGTGEPVRLSAVRSTANVFAVLGADPLLGRTFLPSADAPGAADAVVLSEALWRRRFGSDSGMIGRTLTLDGSAHTVVGVMPAEFRFPVVSSPDLWIPLQPTTEEARRRGYHWLNVMGRLRSGTPMPAAQAEMREIARRIAAAYPEEQAGRSVRLVPLRAVVVGDVRPALVVLFGVAGLVLLIACANVANLLLARAAGRRQEVAIRGALGAGRPRLVRQSLTESILLVTVGATVGLIVAILGVDALVALAGHRLPRAAEIGFDAEVLAFLLITAGFTGMLFGLVPALGASRTDLNGNLLRQAPRQRAAWGGRRLRSALVVGQFALSFVLLIGAGLLLQTFLRLRSADTGMVTENVLTMRLSIPVDQYDGQPVQRFYRPLLERVRALPGVEAAGFVSLLPLQEWGMSGPISIEGEPAAQADNESRAEFRMVSPGYFRAVGISIMRGRSLSRRDDAGTAPVILVNQALVRRYLAGSSALGRRIQGGGLTATVVGVVRDVRQAGVDTEPRPTMYISAAQLNIPSVLDEMSLVVKASVPPLTLTRPIRALVRTIDPDQPVHSVATMEQVVTDSISDRQLYLWLLGSFAAIALMLAAAGIYGVISYTVAQRRHEIGIRVALGARTGAVVALVVRQGALLAVLGLAIGLPLAFALVRLLSSLLYGVSATDASTYAGVSLLLVFVALLASYIPARGSAAVDPMNALREE